MVLLQKALECLGSFVISSNKADKLKKKRVILQSALESYSLLILKSYVGELPFTLMCKCDVCMMRTKNLTDAVLVSHSLNTNYCSQVEVSKGSDIAGTA